MTAEEPWGLALLGAVGLLVGAVNTVAGGGSLLTLPLLILLGLPPATANATNRLGTFLQSAVATVSYARADMLPVRAAAPRLAAASLGALAGARLSLLLAPEDFQRVIAGMMLALVALLLARPERFLRPRPPAPPWLQALAFFVIGGYGGFLQAGAGFFLLAGSALLCGEDLGRANAVKNLLVATFTIPALAVFFAHGLVEPLPGLALASGSMVGGLFGARLALRRGAGFIRAVLVVMVLAVSLRLLV